MRQAQYPHLGQRFCGDTNFGRQDRIISRFRIGSRLERLRFRDLLLIGHGLADAGRDVFQALGFGLRVNMGFESDLNCIKR